jgi:hypothetical protein
LGRWVRTLSSAFREQFPQRVPIGRRASSTISYGEAKAMGRNGVRSPESPSSRSGK